MYLFQVASQVLPSSLLGEAGRFAALPAAVPRSTILRSIALDRISNQLALATCVTLLAPFYLTLGLPPWLRWLLPVPGLLALVGLVLVVRLRRAPTGVPGSWRERLRFLGLLLPDRQGLAPLLIGLVLSGVLGLEFTLAALALPLDVPVGATLLLLVPLLSLLLALMPISFGDWGTREVVSLAVLAPTGLAPADVVAVSLLVGLVNLACALPGVYVVARLRRHRPPE